MKKTKGKALACILVLSLLMAGCAGGAGASPAAPSPAAPAASGDAAPSAGAQATSTEKFTLHAAQVTADSDMDVIGIALQKLKAEVEERTNGNVTIIIHPGGELGPESDYIDMMQSGDLAFGNIASTSFALFTDKLAFLDTPMLFTSMDQLYRFSQTDLAKERLDVLREVGIEPFGMTMVGGRHIMTTKDNPFNSLSDLANDKIRIMSAPMHIEAMEALGIMPSTLTYSECYQGMQTNVIDGMENQLVTYLSMKFYEVAPNISMTPWFQLVHILCVSETVMETLPADYQQIIREAAANALTETNEWSMDWNQHSAPELLNDLPDVTLTYPDVEEIRAKLIPIHEKYAATFGEDVMQWLQDNP